MRLRGSQCQDWLTDWLTDCQLQSNSAQLSRLYLFAHDVCVCVCVCTHTHSGSQRRSCSQKTPARSHINGIVMWTLEHKDQWRQNSGHLLLPSTQTSRGFSYIERTASSLCKPLEISRCNFWLKTYMEIAYTRAVWKVRGLAAVRLLCRGRRWLLCQVVAVGVT
jgi:hypothetical protein